MEENSSNWILELEEALLDEAAPEQIKILLAGRCLPASLRTDVWSHCLDITGRKSKLDKFDDVYDHPDQPLIRQASQKFTELQVVADVESILTVYLKSSGKQYDPKYVELMNPVTRLCLTRNEKYLVFQTIVERFLPVDTESSDSSVFHLSRLLLLYHDPQLCNHIDSLKLSFADFSCSWFRSLLAGDLSPELSQQLWDLYIVNSDPWLIFFMVITTLVNCRDHILEIKTDRDELLARLKRLPGQLEAEDIPDLVTLAQVWSARTPSSFKSLYKATIFTATEAEAEADIKSRLCLPVSSQEVVSSELVNSQLFVVDCRPADQYNNSHLSSAFHLDCGLMLQDPAQFSTACSALLCFHQSAIRDGQGEHLVFLGEGRPGEVEDNMTMAVSRFLQQHTKFISILEGGYCSLQAPAQEKPVKEPKKGKESSEPGKLDILKGNIKSKSENLKSSLLNYIYNPAPQPHVSHTNRNAKQYKGTGDVFSLEEEEDESARPLKEVEKSGDTVHMAQCQRISESGQLSPGWLQVTTTQLVIYMPGNRDGMIVPLSSHHLSTIVKITSKKRQPEIITFKYGTSNKEEVTVFDMDRFFIPTAGKVTNVVKNQIEALK